MLALHGKGQCGNFIRSYAGLECQDDQDLSHHWQLLHVIFCREKRREEKRREEKRREEKRREEKRREEKRRGQRGKGAFGALLRQTWRTPGRFLSAGRPQQRCSVMWNLILSPPKNHLWPFSAFTQGEGARIGGTGERSRPPRLCLSTRVRTYVRVHVPVCEKEGAPLLLHFFHPRQNTDPRLIQWSSTSVWANI